MTDRVRFVLEQAGAGCVEVNAFESGHVASLVSDNMLLDGRDVGAELAELIEQGLVQRPRYTRFGAKARLTKAGRAALSNQA